MNESIKAFWLGLFIVVALALLIWLVLFLKPGVGDGMVKMKVRFSNIDKVAVGTRVTFAGKPVGEVVAIKEIADPRKAPADDSGNLYIYELTLKVDSRVKVFTYDEITFASSGLLGEKSIAIIPKAPPHGALPAQNVTDEVLYAQSSDKIEQTLNKLAGVADTFGDTLAEVGLFIQNNNQDFNLALKNFTSASKELSSFMTRANEADIANQVTLASQSLIASMGRVENFFQVAVGEGTFGRLINSDCLYVQFTTVLCQLRAVLDDIRNFGILYQFDRKWQRMHDAERCCLNR